MEPPAPDLPAAAPRGPESAYRVGADGIRRRGTSVTRLEAFTDAAFAFAVTLLVIAAGGLPRDVAELAADLRGIPAFVASFAIVAFFWTAHYGWSRRYGLETGAAIGWSLALVLVVLIWVYPLRMQIASLFHWISGGWLAAEFAIAQPADLALMFVVYGIGFAALSLVLAALYGHALRQAEALALTPAERVTTRGYALEWLAVAGVATLSVVLAAVTWRLPWGWYNAAPGVVYFLIGLATGLVRWRTERQVRALQVAAS